MDTSPKAAAAEAVAIPNGLAATGEAAADQRGRVSWAMYEWARNPYVALIVIYVFAPYFSTTVVGDPVRGQEIWSLANTIFGVLIALFAPFLGAISDRMGRRKPWILAFTAIMIVCNLMLWFAMPGAEGGLSILAIACLIIMIGMTFEFSAVFHNAMLPSIATPAQLGGLSGLALSLGAAGSLIIMVVMLFGVALPASGAVGWAWLPDVPLFGLDPQTHEHSRISGPVVAAWMALFTIPFILYTPDRPATGISPKSAIVDGLRQVWLTVKSARQMSNVGLYLIARMLYNDGKTAILAYGGIYAAGTFGWGLAPMLIYAVVLSVFAIFGGALGGWLDDRLGSKRAILVSIGGSTLGIVAMLSTTPTQIFFFFPHDAETAAPVWAFPYFQTLPEIIYLVFVIFVAIFITAAYANSRTMMARISPPEMMSQFFGLYALSGTATAFLGHGLVSLFTRIFESQRIGFASTIILLLAGLRRDVLGARGKSQGGLTLGPGSFGSSLGEGMHKDLCMGLGISEILKRLRHTV